MALLMRNIQKQPGALDIRDQRHFDKAGELVIVAINPKTGMVAAHPVAPPSANDPFKFAKDGINTGL